ncbi:hypothetical protein G9C85_10205 [Halorubellus sp. JP-L1]|uniref:hypothetical protein n=1 Tax=Halorubellus sp. JP-L1 TaxID=2715753 RepID=UPI0014072613|nr:hypothetical protein [Halorubellus sp. JP-L1]NHN41998.1 hypothetical protein [Halorubellus sp. JP-L1]
MNRRRALAGALALAAGVGARRLAAARVDDVPLARVRAPGRVGGTFHERSGLAGDPVRGEMDDLDAYAREEFDTTQVAAGVRRFYERTSEYRTTVGAEWHRPFRTGAALAAPLTSRVEQLNLPGPREPDRVRVVRNDLYALDADAARRGGRVDDRVEDARLWVRTDVDTGEAVFVAVYGSHVHDDRRYVNVAVPLPDATLSTVLEPTALALRGRDDVGIDLTTRIGLTTRAPDHPGLYWSTRRADWRLPMHQRFRVWPADATPRDDGPTVDRERALAGIAGDGGDGGEGDADADGGRGDAVVATHEMWLYGRRFLTVRYGAARGRHS